MGLSDLVSLIIGRHSEQECNNEGKEGETKNVPTNEKTADNSLSDVFEEFGVYFKLWSQKNLDRKREQIKKLRETYPTNDEFTAKLVHEFGVISKCFQYISIRSVPELTRDMLSFHPVIHQNDDQVSWVWERANVIDLLGYIESTTNNVLADLFVSSRLQPTKFNLTNELAMVPTRNRHSDSGFDLTLIEKLDTREGVDYYNTGVVLNPPATVWYMLVARSSLAKTGYMLANGVGIIDSGYRGEIIVALRKVNPNAPDLVLPAKVVQIIPQQWYSTAMVNVDSVGTTSRGSTGGLGSAQFFETKSSEQRNNSPQSEVIVGETKESEGPELTSFGTLERTESMSPSSNGLPERTESVAPSSFLN